MKVTFEEAVTQKEVDQIVSEETAIWKKKGKELLSVDIRIDGAYLVVNTKEKSPIKRVRRITGYLADLDGFNSAKKAEVQDRTVNK